jgi:hypothetical protein
MKDISLESLYHRLPLLQSPGRQPKVLCSKLTRTQTQDLDMIASLPPRQRNYSRRKEHGLVVWMGNQETYPFVAEDRERRSRG